jgi:hypothetical protein
MEEVNKKIPALYHVIVFSLLIELSIVWGKKVHGDKSTFFHTHPRLLSKYPCCTSLPLLLNTPILEHHLPFPRMPSGLSALPDTAYAAFCV